MPLFDVPIRAGRAQDSIIVKKSQTTKKSVSAVRGGTDLMGRINEIKAVVERNLGEYRDDYIIINEKEQLADYITASLENKYISIDTETNGLDPLQNMLVGVCLYTRGQKGAYIPLNHISYITGVKADGQLPMQFTMEQLCRLHGIDIDMFNAKFDIRFLRANGWKDAYCTWDGYLGSQLLNENEFTHGLKALHKKYVLGDKKDAFSFDELFKGITFDKVPINVAYLYAAHDPVITTEYCDYQRKYLRPDNDRQDMRDIYWVFKNIEMPCINVVADMEDAGIEFDMNYQQELSEKYNKLLVEKEQAFHKACNLYKKEIEAYRNATHYPDAEHAHYKTGSFKGSDKLDNPINMGSPTQLAILLYDIIGIKSVDDKKPRGTGEDILSKIKEPDGAVSICQAVLAYREMSKLVSTYIDKLPDCVNPKDGRIHCSFNQYGARTGRFSSSDPNLQNIPSHNKDIRKMFKATDGYVLMSSDYSQQEPKVMTQMCQDPKMMEAYHNDKDLYAEIAALSFNTTYRECLEFMTDDKGNWVLDENGERITYKAGKERRSQAKSILLGVLYGRGVPSIAEQLGVTTQKAQKIKDSVFKGFPAIPKFEEDSLAMAEDLGYVTTLWGRKRRLPDLQLPEFEFTWKDGAPPDDDLLDFDDGFMNEAIEQEVPEDIQDYYLAKLRKSWGSQKRKVFEEANKEGIWIIDNGAKIADAQRQCVNARIQGSAADMSKLAMILVGNDTRLKELGFRLLIPVHDELIAECPIENAKECKERFAMLMAKAAESRLTIPIKCDVEVTYCWYGEKVEI